MIELRKELAKIFEAVKTGKMDIDQAKTLTGTANSIISSCYVQLDQQKFLGSGDGVEFLKEPPKELKK